MALDHPSANTDQPTGVDGTPPKRGRGRPVGDRDAKRGAILNAAIEVIAKEGYSGASLRKVGAQVGSTTGAVTYYFADKEAMVTEVARHIWDKWDSMRSGPGEHDKGLRKFVPMVFEPLVGPEADRDLTRRIGELADCDWTTNIYPVLPTLEQSLLQRQVRDLDLQHQTRELDIYSRTVMPDVKPLMPMARPGSFA